jgi:hypothetical protein
VGQRGFITAVSTFLTAILIVNRTIGKKVTRETVKGRETEITLSELRIIQQRSRRL